MKIAQKTKYAFAALLFTFATTALSFANVQFASAASLTWTGAGDGTDFSDTANWNTGAAPQDGDVVTFSFTGLTAQRVLNNDISGLSLDGISFTGNASDYYSYTIQGNDITLTGDVTNTVTGAQADYMIPTIQANLILASNVAVNKANIGVGGATLALGSNALTYSGSASCGLTILSDISGSGALNLTGTGINVRGTNSSYTGPINVTAGTARIAPAALGTSAGATTVSGTGELAIIHYTDVSSAEPFTLGGSGSFSSAQNYWGCSGGSGPAANLTLTGGVTLTSDMVYKGENNLIINNPYTANGHSFTVGGGISGTLTTPQGEATAPEQTVPLDGDSSTYVSIGNKQTGVLNGTRDNIGVQAGGILKGTGTADNIYVNDGGKIAPGNSPGTMTVLTQLSLSGTYEAEILDATTYDQLVVGEDYSGGGNAVFLNSDAVLSTVLYDGWKVATSDAFRIIDNRSSTAVSGTFSGLAEGAQFTVDGITFNITYVGGDGNDVVITALNAGTDPTPPNTGALQIIRKNPLVVAGLGIVTAALLFAVAMRRRQNSK